MVDPATVRVSVPSQKRTDERPQTAAASIEGAEGGAISDEIRLEVELFGSRKKILSEASEAIQMGFRPISPTSQRKIYWSDGIEK